MSFKMSGGEQPKADRGAAKFEVSEMHELHLSDVTGLKALNNTLKRRTVLDRFHKKESWDNLDVFDKEHGGKMFVIREGEAIKGFLGLTITETDEGVGRVAHIKSLRTEKRDPEMMSALLTQALAYLRDEDKADTVSLSFSADQKEALHANEQVLRSLHFEPKGHDDRGYETFSRSVR